MPKQLEILKCEICGNIVEVISGGAGEMTCCKTPMKLMIEGGTDAAKEKHVPVLKKTDNGYKVAVGSVPHPMEDKHWIQWVELVADGISYMRFLKPGDAPEAEFRVSGKNVYAREYCNLHGHWKASEQA
ncbi:MAG: desulfoferrodoxin [Desulfovibrio sp.]|nr:desulfoferrodoxin [Desulfovibrio sp.]